MPSCPLCHEQNPKPSTRVTSANASSWSLAANVLLTVGQRICSSHLDKDGKPTLHINKKIDKGLDGRYWKTDKKRGRYNIINKPLTSQEHSLLSIITQHTSSLQHKQQCIQTLQHQLTTPAPIQTKVDIIDERYLSHFFRIGMYKSHPHHIQILLGIPNWEQLERLTKLIMPDLPSLQLPILYKDVVAFVLLRLRRGLQHRAIAAMYNISATRTTELSNIALRALAKELKCHVKLLDKDQMLQNTPPSVQEQYPNAKIYICDDTYIYIQHSDDLNLQHGSFSNHKYRNLAKFFIGCAPNGTILTVEGPYECDADDEILQTSLDKDVNAWLDDGDIVVVDRGFQEAPNQVVDGVMVLQPAYLQGQAQFSLSDRVMSIKVSQLRCVIENVNARLKAYHLLTNVYPNKALDLLADYVLVAAALSNLYYKPLRSTTWKANQ